MLILLPYKNQEYDPSGMWNHVVWYLGTSVSDWPAVPISWILFWVYHPTQKMEAPSFWKHIYQNTNCHIPDDDNLVTHHHENLKIFL